MTTVAKGRWTSLPVPFDSSNGIKPNAVVTAVIRTGRKRKHAPRCEASSIGIPSRTSWLKYVTSTMPFSNAIPNRAIKPTEDGTERFCPDSHSATTPPTRASGMFMRISAAFFKERKLLNNKRKMMSSVTGTTTAKRRLASCCNRDRKSTRLNSSHTDISRMPSSA